MFLEIGKGLASIAVCGLGGYCVYVTQSASGVWLAILGLFIIWFFG